MRGSHEADVHAICARSAPSSARSIAVSKPYTAPIDKSVNLALDHKIVFDYVTAFVAPVIGRRHDEFVFYRV